MRRRRNGKGNGRYVHRLWYERQRHKLAARTIREQILRTVFLLQQLWCDFFSCSADVCGCRDFNGLADMYSVVRAQAHPRNLITCAYKIRNSRYSSTLYEVVKWSYTKGCHGPRAATATATTWTDSVMAFAKLFKWTVAGDGRDWLWTMIN